MKKTSKQWLAGILVSSMALSAVAMNQKAPTTEFQEVSAITATEEVADLYAGTPETVQTFPQEVSTEEIPEETGTNISDLSIFKSTDAYFATLSSSSAFDQFYGKYGYENAAYVFYNGQPLTFTDAFPLIQNGSTFIPLAAFGDVIGAVTGYEADTHSVTLQYQGDTIAFAINDNKYYVNNGPAQELPMATFTVNERTMVPLSFITDAFGLDLYWNASYKQVISADLDSLTKDKEFTLLNSLLDFMNGEVTEQNAKLTGTFDYTVSQGDKTMGLSSDILAHANSNMSGVSYEMDFAVDVTAFESEIRALFASMSPTPEEDAGMVDVLLAAVEEFDLNYMYDFENLEFYLQSQLVADLLPVVSLSTNNLDIDGDTWFKLSLGSFLSDAEVASMKAMMGQLSGQSALHDVDDLIESAMNMTRYQDNYLSDSYGGLKTMLEDTHDGKFEAIADGYQTTGSYAFNGETVFYDLTLRVGEDKEVEGYTAVVTFQEKNNDVIRMTISQDTTETAEIVVDGVFSGITVSMAGAFEVEGTNEITAVRPTTGNVFDLSTLF